MNATARTLALLGLTLSFAACNDARPVEDSTDSAAEAELAALARTTTPKPAPEPEERVVEELGHEEPIYASAARPVALNPKPAAREPDTQLDPRDAALVPEGTPEANAVAFAAMRTTNKDGRPVGGIGPQGIHVDSLVVGRGFAKSQCESETAFFEVGEDDRANLCLRVVHGGHIDETLKVEWKRDGRGPKATELSLRGGHAYRTRAYLPIRHYSTGVWTVTVSASDGTVLGSAEFEIT